MNIAVLASGEGTTLQAVLDACARQRLPARVGVVISNNPTAGALRRARAAGVPARRSDGYAERGNPGGGGRVQVADGGSVVMHCHLTCANDSANVNPG